MSIGYTVNTHQLSQTKLLVWRPDLPKERPLPVLYCTDGDMLQGIEPVLTGLLTADSVAAASPCLLVGVYADDRDRDYTPWPAPAVFRGAAPFGGGASGHLQLITKQVLPFIQAQYRVLPGPQAAGIAGYSLGGLFAIYAAYASSAFGFAASMSGSMWFPRWLEYMGQNQPRAGGYYLSLGDTEEKTRHPVMSQVGACALQAADILRQKVGDDAVTYRWERGDHFTGIPQRHAHMLRWFCWQQALLGHTSQ